jgi:hypothetical protein
MMENENPMGEGIFAGIPRGACVQGIGVAGASSPCPYPASKPLPRWEDAGPRICDYHAAQQPLIDELDEMGVSLEKLEELLIDARKSHAVTGRGEQLVICLERIKADFSGRFELAKRVIEDLDAAEHALMRG